MSFRPPLFKTTDDPPLSDDFKPFEISLDGGGSGASNPKVIFTRFIMDGRNQLSAVSVLHFVAPYALTIKGLGARVKLPRSSGSLSLKIKKAGSDVAGSGITIDNTSTQEKHINSLSESATEGQLIEIEATSSSFAPLANICDIYLLFT